MAYGEQPRWALASGRGGLLLTLGERPPLRLSSKGWQDTPAGRQLTMTTADGGMVTLTVVHGLCAPAFGSKRRGMIATLTIGELRLQGCFDGDGGNIPYPGG